jgi:hypothetical protein
LRDLRHDVSQLQTYHTVASQEIEDLRAEVERLHSTEDLGANADIESEEESRSKKRRKSKGKKPIRPRNNNSNEEFGSNSDEDEEAARVRYVFILQYRNIVFLLTEILQNFISNSFNLGRNENNS